MTDTHINWLRCEGKYTISNDRTIYSGPTPFSFDKESQEDMDRMYKVPWVISHETTRDKLYKVVGLESFAMRYIREGTMIGLMVEEVE